MTDTSRIEPTHRGEPCVHAHTVHFYDDDHALYASVGKFLNAGLIAGDRMAIVVTAEHGDGILAELDQELCASAVASGRLQRLDAHETLAQLMDREEMIPARFEAVLGGVLDHLRRDAPSANVRLFGEMVDILWKAGNTTAALVLEELWDEACKRHGFQLLCAYGDFFSRATSGDLADVRERHTRVLLPEEPITRRESGLEDPIVALETELRRRRGTEGALRRALRDLQQHIVREREARLKVEEGERFKDELLGVLGHDLRGPLSTVLMTTRLMLMRSELPPETALRMHRVVTSGLRMQRMIEQLLDTTCDRSGDGTMVIRRSKGDLAELTTAVVRNVRLTHPARSVDLVIGSACFAPIDRERIEQVLRTLLENALAHGAGDRPIRVTVESFDTTIRVEVHNHGTPIPEEVRAALFDPFRPSRKAGNTSEGLGLGLHIADRIVRAHAGLLAVESSAAGGTRFRITLPHDAGS